MSIALAGLQWILTMLVLQNYMVIGFRMLHGQFHWNVLLGVKVIVLFRRFWFISLIVLFGCESDFEVVLSGKISEYKNLIVYPPDLDPSSEVHLIRERTYGNTEEDLIGIASSIAIDRHRRVFIGDAAKYTVHVFLHDGSYLTSIGREGRGPGEFMASPFPVIISDRLYVYDAMQLRINVYSIDSFELLKTINLNPVNHDSIEDLAGFYISQLIFRSKGKFLAVFRRHFAYLNLNPQSSSHVEDSGELKYYLIDQEGRILPEKILEQSGAKYLTATVRGDFRYMQYPYLGKPLFTAGVDGQMYSARSEDFLIEVRNSNGRYMHAFYYPIEKRAFSREEALRRAEVWKNFFGYDDSVLEVWKSILQRVPDESLPQAWPVLNSILIDDENRLWLSTLTENVEEYEWWVLKNTGELLARFSWPINREVREVKNGFIYSLEIDKDSGERTFVRYRIEMRLVEN